MTGKRAAAVVLIAAIFVAIAAAILIAWQDDDGGETSSATTTTTTKPVTGKAKSLADLVAASHELELHVHFIGTSGDPVSTPRVLELWREGGRYRQDLVYGAAEEETRLASFAVGTDRVSCSKVPEKEWACQEFTTTQENSSRPAGLFESAIVDLGSATVTETAEKIAAVDARCFKVVYKDDTQRQLCLSEEGVPLRITIENTTFTADVVERDVANDVFKPPAEVVRIADTTKPE